MVVDAALSGWLLDRASASIASSRSSKPGQAGLQVRFLVEA